MWRIFPNKNTSVSTVECRALSFVKAQIKAVICCKSILLYIICSRAMLLSRSQGHNRCRDNKNKPHWHKTNWKQQNYSCKPKRSERNKTEELEVNTANTLSPKLKESTISSRLYGPWTHVGCRVSPNKMKSKNLDDVYIRTTIRMYSMKLSGTWNLKTPKNTPTAAQSHGSHDGTCNVTVRNCVEISQ